MKPAVIGFGCAIAVLSTSTTALSHPVHLVEEIPHSQTYSFPTIGSPSIIHYPSISYPQPQRGFGLPVTPTLPIVPTAPTFISPYSQNSVITLPSVEIHPRRYSSYSYRRYPSSRSKIIYINPSHSHTRETVIIYSYPTTPHNPYTPFGH